MSDAVEEIDKAIRELRTVIFGLKSRRGGGGLRGRVLSLVSEYEPHLGFTPHLQFDGISRASVTAMAADELIGALREILSGIARDSLAREAEIKIGITDGVLRLQVTDDRDAPTAQSAGDTSAPDSMSGRADAPDSMSPMTHGTSHSALSGGPGSYRFVPAPSATACFQVYV